MTSPTSKQKWVMMLAGVAMTSLKIYRKKDVEKYRNTKSDVWKESARRI
jgi:hypothetical protein